MMQSAYLTWLLLIPLIFSLVAFAARWLGSASRLVIHISHLVSVSLVLAAAFLSMTMLSLARSSSPIDGPPPPARLPGDPPTPAELPRPDLPPGKRFF